MRFTNASLHNRAKHNSTARNTCTKSTPAALLQHFQCVSQSLACTTLQSTIEQRATHATKALLLQHFHCVSQSLACTTLQNTIEQQQATSTQQQTKITEVASPMGNFPSTLRPCSAHEPSMLRNRRSAELSLPHSETCFVWKNLGLPAPECFPKHVACETSLRNIHLQLSNRSSYNSFHKQWIAQPCKTQ